MRSTTLRHMTGYRRWSLPLLAAIGLTLSACGQKGPLTLPKHDQVSPPPAGQMDGTTKPQSNEDQP